jgi:glycosyltransferase A (GT-A) superfamily protein (DUF2064 family)
VSGRGVHLTVVAKEPVAGRVKTRMSPPCTPDEAAAIAEAALADTLDAASGCGADRVVLALDGDPGPWLPAGVEVVPQGDGPFAERLHRVWTAVGTPGLQIGMDTPQLTADDLDGALARLARPEVDAVLGPALDGGWWALGLHRPCADPFTGVPMSRPDTGDRQHARLVTLGLRVESLEVRRDADDFTDAVALAEECPTTRFSAAVGRVSRRR